MKTDSDRWLKAIEGVTGAVVDAALAPYRAVRVRQPVAGEEFGHVMRAGEFLSLCTGVAVLRPERQAPVRLHLVDCVLCLEALTRALRDDSRRAVQSVAPILPDAWWDDVEACHGASVEPPCDADEFEG